MTPMQKELSMNTSGALAHAERKVLFVHDGPLHIAPDGVPRGVHYTPALLDRYMLLGGQLTFVLRAKAIAQDEAERYSALARDHFRFVAVPDVKSLRGMISGRRAANAIIAREVAACDVVVARLPSTIGRWAYWEARRRGKPVLVEFMACTWDSMWNNRLKAKVLAPYFFLKNRALVRTASHVVYVTDRFLQRRYPTRGKSIGCSNVVVTPAPAEALVARRARICALGQNGPVILATVAGVDVPYKNQAAVLHALYRLGEERRHFLYRIVGPGDPARLVALAARLGVSDCVRFEGAVRHAEIPALLDETDIYVQPSRQEGLPRALIEAMSRGCAAIGARTGGIPELLEEGEIFEPGDHAHLADLLRGWTPAALEAAATRNVAVAAGYVTEVLNARRADFYAAFLRDHGCAA